MDLSEVVYIIRTLKPVNGWIPAREMTFFKESVVTTGLSFWGHLGNRAIRDLDFEKAVFKLSYMEYAQLITFYSEALTLFFLMNVYKRWKETRAGACCPDICWGTHCKRILRWCWTGGDLYILRNLGNHLAKLRNSQVCIYWEALKVKFRQWNGSLIFLADHCFKELSKVVSRLHS